MTVVSTTISVLRIIGDGDVVEGPGGAPGAVDADGLENVGRGSP